MPSPPPVPGVRASTVCALHCVNGWPEIEGHPIAPMPALSCMALVVVDSLIPKRTKWELKGVTMSKPVSLRADRTNQAVVEEGRFVLDPDAIDRHAAELEKYAHRHQDGPQAARSQAAELRRLAAELRRDGAA